MKTLLISLLGFLILRTLEYIVDKLAPRAKKTKTKVDDYIIEWLKFIISGLNKMKKLKKP